MVGSFEWSLDREKHYPWLPLTNCNTTLSISISLTSLSVCPLCVLFPPAFPFILLSRFLQPIHISSRRIFESYFIFLNVTLEEDSFILLLDCLP
jgi:hypothetical protein